MYPYICVCVLILWGLVKCISLCRENMQKTVACDIAAKDTLT